MIFEAKFFEAEVSLIMQNENFWEQKSRGRKFLMQMFKN